MLNSCDRSECKSALHTANLYQMTSNVSESSTFLSLFNEKFQRCFRNCFNSQLNGNSIYISEHSNSPQSNNSKCNKSTSVSTHTQTDEDWWKNIVTRPRVSSKLHLYFNVLKLLNTFNISNSLIHINIYLLIASHQTTTPSLTLSLNINFRFLIYLYFRLLHSEFEHLSN